MIIHKRPTTLLLTVLFIVSIICIDHAFAQMKDAPADVAAAIIIKIAAFEKKVSSEEKSITIYVLGDPAVAAEFKKGIGQSIGKATLKNVERGAGLPGSPPDILYIGDRTNIKAVLEYTHTNKVLSATGIPDLVEKGVALGVGIGEDDKPKVLLNLTGSAEEGLNWNPAVIKIAKTIK